MVPDVDLVLLTESRYERPTHITPNIANLLEEDRLLGEALARRGIRTERVDWARPDVDWAAVPRALFRTTWDYFLRWDEFRAWLERAAARTELINPPALIRWNTDKHYLAELSAGGVPTVETRFLDRGHPGSLADALDDAGWEEAVLKPAISGGGRHTYRVRRAAVGEHEAIARERIDAEDMLLQPFLEDVVARGEVTLVVLGGEVSHGVLKVARQGEFRVQDDFGGTVHPHAPTVDEIAVAEAAIAACPVAPLYGRVDLVRAADGRLAVMEVEVVEPELWLRLHPPAAERFADLLAAHI